MTIHWPFKESHVYEDWRANTPWGHLFQRFSKMDICQTVGCDVWNSATPGAKPRQRSSAKPPGYFSVIDPGSTNLRVLIVEVADGHATVWGWAERSGWIDGNPNVHDLFAACSELQAEAEEMARDRAERWFLPDQMIVGLPASQLVGRAWPVAQTRSRPERPMDEREVEALLSRALRLTVNRLLSIVQPEAPPDSDDPDWLLIEAVPVALVVDGRGVTDLVGFRGRELHAMVFAALGRTE